MLQCFLNFVFRVSLFCVPILLVYRGLEQNNAANAALYPRDNRRAMQEEDYKRYTGGGILFCRDEDHIPRRAANAWLIGHQRLILMNAHNFRDKNATATRALGDCFFQINGKNYEFVPDSLRLGISDEARSLHITDDWALAFLKTDAGPANSPQRLYPMLTLPTGTMTLDVTMVSPAGHENFKEDSSIESCFIHFVDPQNEDNMRRVRHDCNDGFGGSGSGLFDEGGHMIAMQSASLDMNRRTAFDIELHYGSALLLEGDLAKAIQNMAATTP